MGDAGAVVVDRGSLERATQRIGRQLLESARPRPWQPRWWNERLMTWMMSQPSLRLQAFRFVDVLPSLSNRDAIAGHLAEYLGEVEGSGAAARLMRLIGKSVSGVPRPIRRLVAGMKPSPTSSTSPSPSPVSPLTRFRR